MHREAEETPLEV